MGRRLRLITDSLDVIRARLFFRPVFRALLIAVFLCHPALAADSADPISEILSSAESLFRSMKDRDHKAIWGKLSAASRRAIVEETRKEISRAPEGKSPSDEAIRLDFEEGGPIGQAYWTGFLANFDPVIVLERSKWETGKVAGDRAEIVLTHAKSEKPAVLKLFREDGRWKVGLVETFWGRR